jgi:hypothetical protein
MPFCLTIYYLIRKQIPDCCIAYIFFAVLNTSINKEYEKQEMIGFNIWTKNIALYFYRIFFFYRNFNSNY